MKYRISEYAKIKGKSKGTIRNWIAKGKLKTIEEDGKIWVTEEIKSTPNVAIYARVSSYGNSEKLNDQVEKLTNYCNSKGYNIVRIVKEVGSNIDENRSKLRSILIDNKIDIIVIENRNTLVRFGLNYINELLSLNNRKIEFIEDTETNREELLGEFSDLVSEYSYKLYGKQLKISIKEGDE